MLIEEKDIGIILLNKIEASFIAKMNSDEKVKLLVRGLGSPDLGYAQAQDHAIEVARILSDVFAEFITPDVLPDGKMHYDIASQILNKTLKNNYKLISFFNKKVQEALNTKASIGIKAMIPPLNQNRVNGLINRVSEDVFENVRWVLKAPVETFSLSIVDESVKLNADFQSRSGLKPKIVRSSRGKCCDWCDNLVGTYDYESVSNTGNDVYRRHSNCRCLVEFVPVKGQGPRRNVWTHRDSE